MDRETMMRDAYYGDIQRVGDIGGALLGDFQSRAQAYNPTNAFERRLQAAQTAFKRDWTKGVGDLRGQQVASGRVNTGFGFQDQDRLFSNLANRFAETSGNAALQTAGLDLQHMGMLGGVGSALTGNALDARGGEYQTLRQQRLTDKAGKRNFWGGLLGAGLGAAGMILGGPIGGLIGGGIGNALGGGGGGQPPAAPAAPPVNPAGGGTRPQMPVRRRPGGGY